MIAFYQYGVRLIYSSLWLSVSLMVVRYSGVLLWYFGSGTFFSCKNAMDKDSESRNGVSEIRSVRFYAAYINRRVDRSHYSYYP